MDGLEHLMDEGIAKYNRWLFVLVLSGNAEHGNPGTSFIMGMIKMINSSYPERMERMFIVDAGWVANMIWSMAKPFLKAKTIRKIKMVLKKGFWSPF